VAQRIPQEVIEEIRQRTNIVDVVGQYVQLKKSGKNYMGLCPFHEERSPHFQLQKTSKFSTASAAEKAELFLIFCRKSKELISRIPFAEWRN
jgi:hypothetical protein